MVDAHRMDEVLFNLAPLVRVPVYSALEGMDTAGMRYLMAKNGLWLEVNNDWLHARVLVSANVDFVQLPAGVISEFCHFKFGKLPKELLEGFLVQARAEHPNEVAAVGMWHAERGSFRLEFCSETSSANHTDTMRPIPKDGEIMVLDIHSHGAHRAFFSATDDLDDKGEIKISVVVGKLDQTPEVMARVCVLGRFLPVAAL